MKREALAWIAALGLGAVVVWQGLQMQRLEDALRPAFHRPPSHEALSPDIRQASERLLAKAEAQRSRDMLRVQTVMAEIAEANLQALHQAGSLQQQQLALVT